MACVIAGAKRRDHVVGLAGVADPLRRSEVPAGLCHQLLRDEDQLALHGLVAAHVDGAGRRLDVRGNRPGMDARFDLAEERLAFRPDATAGERDLVELLTEPAPAVVRCLEEATSLPEARLP